MYTPKLCRASQTNKGNADSDFDYAQHHVKHHLRSEQSIDVATAGPCDPLVRSEPLPETITARFTMPYSIESKVRDLLDNDESRSIIESVLPGFASHPQVGIARGMALSVVAKFSDGLITDDALQRIDAALKALD